VNTVRITYGILIAALGLIPEVSCAAFPTDRIVPVAPSLKDYNLSGPVRQVDFLPDLDWVAEDEEYRWEPPGEPTYTIYGFNRDGRRIRKALTLWARDNVVGQRADELNSDRRWDLTQRGLISAVREVAREPTLTVVYSIHESADRIENTSLVPQKDIAVYNEDLLRKHVLVLREDDAVEHRRYRRWNDQHPFRIDVHNASGELIEGVRSPSSRRPDDEEYRNGKLVGVTEYSFGELKRRRELQYNDRGLLEREIVTELSVREDGSVSSESEIIREYEYDFDRRGNWIEQRVYRLHEDGSREPVLARRRMIEYFE